MPLFSQSREVVKFQVDLGEETSGGFDSIFVSGDIAELGNYDPMRSIALTQKEDNIWEADLSLPVNRTFTYRYFRRSNFNGGLDSDIREAIGDPIKASTSIVALDPATKSFSYRGSLNRPILHWRQTPSDDFTMTALVAVVDRWELARFGQSNRRTEFFLTSGAAREPAALGGLPEDDPTYSTDSDQIFVQNEEIFTYQPAFLISPPRRDYDPGNLPSIQSRILSEDRPYRVFLPRGYDEQTERFYPVIYFLSGQQLFEDDVTVLGNPTRIAPALDPDASTLSATIASGRMCIF